MKPILGVFLGEATGVGPELIAKLCAQGTLKSHCRPVLIGDLRILELGKKIAGVEFPVAVVNDVAEIDWDGPVAILDQKNLNPADFELGKVNAHSGKVTGDTLVSSIGLLQKGAIDGLVFGPLNKQAFKLGGYHYADEHALFANLLNCTQPNGIMNMLDNLWTFRVTCHIPFCDVPANLDKGKVLSSIKLADSTLKKAGYERPRIGVAALNPHAGEGGLCGKEEVDIIQPAVEEARGEGIEAIGPVSADIIFLNAFKKGTYDAVVTMYHDQGQIATKLVGFEVGVTVYAGLPYPIATPEHGTAFDIAGKGIADTRATEQAVIIASRMAMRR